MSNHTIDPLIGPKYVLEGGELGLMGPRGMGPRGDGIDAGWRS